MARANECANTGADNAPFYTLRPSEDYGSVTAVLRLIRGVSRARARRVVFASAHKCALSNDRAAAISCAPYACVMRTNSNARAAPWRADVIGLSSCAALAARFSPGVRHRSRIRPTAVSVRRDFTFHASHHKEMSMKSLFDSTLQLAAITWVGALAFTLAASSSLNALSSAAQDPCKKSALEVKKSCDQGAISDLWLARANCSNLRTVAERTQCMIDSLDEYFEAKAECKEQFIARRELCNQLGGAVYAPLIDPANFVAQINNPYMPLIPGTSFSYEKQSNEGLERIELTVTHATKEILGVTCTVVHDLVTLDDVTIEDTFDWFAQDVLGNVWYFGELSFEYEDGEIVNMAGTWKAGEDSAHPGIVALAAPQLGQVYRQEYLLGEAEDVAQVLSLTAPVVVPYGSFPNCLQTMDYTPISPDHIEYKYYAPGVGVVLEIDPESGERTELVNVVFTP
jgi:hypothetical protein